MKVEPDSWLADIFGIDVFKVSLSGDEGVGFSYDKLVAGSEGKHAFYYTKVPSQRIDQVSALTEVGFRVVDVNVTMERKPEQGETTNSGIRDAMTGDHHQLLGIAESCFVYSRFHLDPGISNKTANSVKREWIRNYLLGNRGERLLVGESHGTVAGFLAVLAVTVNGAPTTRVIDLIGIDKLHQRKGVGRKLVDFFIHDSAGQYESLIVGTQAANSPSIRFYESCGFRYASSSYVLHAHLPL